MEIPGTLCSNVYDFAFCPEPSYDRLVDLADPEDWGPSNRILKNYLSFSFSRAVFLTERDVNQTAPSNLPLVFDDDLRSTAQLSLSLCASSSNRQSLYLLFHCLKRAVRLCFGKHNSNHFANHHG